MMAMCFIGVSPVATDIHPPFQPVTCWAGPVSERLRRLVGGTRKYVSGFVVAWRPESNPGAVAS